MLNIISVKLSQFREKDIEDIGWLDRNDVTDDIKLVDDIETSPYLEPRVSEPGEYMEEIPTINEYTTPNATKEVVYSNVRQLLSDAMKTNEPNEYPEVIGFFYVNRYGFPVGWRVVEPHKEIYAYTTGNDILVTWDRGVNDIRSFIIGNIQPNAVRYEGEEFNRREEIMRERTKQIGEQNVRY